MADVYTRIGYIKGATGAKGDTGEKGDTGDAATIEVGSVTTVPYGQTANVVNSGTEQAAVFDFTIPQGRPGQQVTEMDNLLLNSITTSAAEFPLPAVGETGKVLWGKVVKWFSDMTALVATKLNAANVLNNLTATTSGYALDARQGKVLDEKITNLVYSQRLQFTVDETKSAGTLIYNGRLTFTGVSFTTAPIISALVGTYAADSYAQLFGLSFHAVGTGGVNIRARALGTIGAGDYYIDVIAMQRTGT